MNDLSTDDRRQSRRFQTLNLLSYYEKDDNGDIVAHGIAKTLDLSESGAQIALSNSFSYPGNIEIEIALEEEIIRVEVDIIEQIEVESDVWHIRLKFKGLRPAQRHRLAVFIRSIK